MFRLETQGAVARVVIDRGAARNAIPIAGWTALEKLVNEAGARKETRLIVIESADPHSFCAGADLAELATLRDNPRQRHVFRCAMLSAFKRIRAIGKPTLAVIEGGCYGAGVSLAMACDLRVAGPEADFAITPARFGISYPQEDLSALIKLVGPGQAARLVYSAERIPADEALRIGLVELIDRETPTGAAMVKAIADKAPYSLLALKATMAGRFGVDQRFDDAFGGRDFAEGFEAFRHNRTPDFT
ncbi:enoyl-CoA hydratase/isomerase family protein [Sphingomonas morindae]|uniref:Enoyl-CoA hydratase/isomerase family protein n=1 Tax=Sphingomonas morindae TaxID=1541170 RepID=A0ABY4X4Q6_9SPHN|nr:enoyl-CoA hydratase/isomerase family protein [Sphingomonas morindae]USI71879.1 enoyl-CoA hydratase/isomerase family protein [Sphingomonas morindae]